MSQPETKLFRPPDRARTRDLYATLLPIHEQALLNLQGRIRTLLEATGLSPTIRYRVKRFAAYFEKLRRSASKRQGPPTITDLLGLRIVCPFLEDLSRVETCLRENFEILETVRKAADHSFREFGYDSVHLLARLDQELPQAHLPHTRRVVEIQLRTILQDAWAEVEHELVYKSSLAGPNESVRRKLAALNATLTLSDLTFQEIRDYQKNLRRLNHKRRSVLEQAQAIPGLETPVAETAQLPQDPPPLPLVQGSPLEKAMLQALQAHSRQHFGRAVELYGTILGMRLPRRIRSLVYNHRGMALFALGRQREALRDFSRAIDYDPENLRALCNRGLVLRLELRYARALEDFDRALACDPAYGEALLGRAQLYLEMRYPDRALYDCRHALEVVPDLPAARALEARIRREFFTT